MNRSYPLLGVLGGLGPMSTFYFCQLLTCHTAATCDSDHIDMLISSRATTPDRTAFILGTSHEDPLPVMQQEAEWLTRAGAGLLVIPCNTAHYFIDEVRKSVSVPVPSIIEETAAHLKRAGVKKAGILATVGTVSSGSYQTKLEGVGLLSAVPDEREQRWLMELIYDDVKAGREPDLDKFFAVVEHMKDKGCDRMILGCTELSVINRSIGGREELTDSLEVLANVAIKLCGHETVGFSPEFDLI